MKIFLELPYDIAIRPSTPPEMPAGNFNLCLDGKLDTENASLNGLRERLYYILDRPRHNKPDKQYQTHLTYRQASAVINMLLYPFLSPEQRGDDIRFERNNNNIWVDLIHIRSPAGTHLRQPGKDSFIDTTPFDFNNPEPTP